MKYKQRAIVAIFSLFLSAGLSNVCAQSLPTTEKKTATDYSHHVFTNEIIDNQISLIAQQNKEESVISELLQYAQEFLGRPYRRGSKGPSSFDCSGFTSYIFKQFKYKLNPSSSTQYRQGTAIKKENIRPGDLVFFKGSNSGRSNVGHVGVISEILPNGQFKFIHASTSKGICEDRSSEAYYKRRFVGVRRIIDYGDI